MTTRERALLRKVKQRLLKRLAAVLEEDIGTDGYWADMVAACGVPTVAGVPDAVQTNTRAWIHEMATTLQLRADRMTSREGLRRRSLDEGARK